MVQNFVHPRYVLQVAHRFPLKTTGEAYQKKKRFLHTPTTPRNFAGPNRPSPAPLGAPRRRPQGVGVRSIQLLLQTRQRAAQQLLALRVCESASAKRPGSPSRGTHGTRPKNKTNGALWRKKPRPSRDSVVPCLWMGGDQVVVILRGLLKNLAIQRPS